MLRTAGSRWRWRICLRSRTRGCSRCRVPAPGGAPPAPRVIPVAAELSHPTRVLQTRRTLARTEAMGAETLSDLSDQRGRLQGDPPPGNPTHQPHHVTPRRNGCHKKRGEKPKTQHTPQEKNPRLPPRVAEQRCVAAAAAGMGAKLRQIDDDLNISNRIMKRMHLRSWRCVTTATLPLPLLLPRRHLHFAAFVALSVAVPAALPSQVAHSAFAVPVAAAR